MSVNLKVLNRYFGERSILWVDGIKKGNTDGENSSNIVGPDELDIVE
jgi:hypothetical protein